MKKIVTICEDVLSCYNNQITINDWHIVLNELNKVYDIELIAFEDIKNIKIKYNYIKNTYPQCKYINIIPNENKYGLFFKRTKRDYFMTISSNIKLLVLLDSKYKIIYGKNESSCDMYLRAYNPKKLLEYIKIIKYNIA